MFDVLDMFDAKRRQDIRGVVGALGQGFAGRGAELNQALDNSGAVVSDFGQVASTVNSDAGAAARFVPDLQTLSAAFDPVREQIAAGFGPEADSLEPWVSERAPLQTTLSEGPSALAQLRTGLAETDPLLIRTEGLSQSLVKLTAVAPAAFHEATDLLRAAPTPLRSTRTLLRSLSGAVPRTLSALNAIAPLAAPTTRSLGNSIPELYELARYTCEIDQWPGDWYRIFEYGTDPMTSAGLSGYMRMAAAVNTLTSSPNVPSSKISESFYPAPCTAEGQHT